MTVLSHDGDENNELGSDLYIGYIDPKTNQQRKWTFGISGKQNCWLESEAIYFRNKSKFFYYEDNKISAKGWGNLKNIHRLYFYNENEELSRILLFSGMTVIAVIRIKGRKDNWEFYHKRSKLDLDFFGAKYEKLSYEN